MSLYWKEWANQQADVWLAKSEVMHQSAVSYCSTESELATTQAAFTDLLSHWAYINGYPYKAIDEQALAFSLYFWPDKRNVTEIRLGARIGSGQILDASEYDQLIAAEKGIPAMEWLLFKEDLSRQDRCTLLVAISDIYRTDVASLHAYHQTSDVIQEEWTADADIIAGRSIALNLLYAQISRMESHLRQSRDEEGLWIDYMAEGWRSENTWMVYQQSLTSLNEMLKQTAATSTISVENKSETEGYISQAEQILLDMAALEGHQQNSQLLDQLHDLLLQLTGFLETRLAENFGILIGFNNFDGD